MDSDVALTPVLEQYLKIKGEHKNEILFFRVGDFYEMFFDDAVEVSRLLNLTLTHKGAAPMCGIPYHAAKIYIARLLRAGRIVVIWEQVGDPKASMLQQRLFRLPAGVPLKWRNSFLRSWGVVLRVKFFFRNR